MQREARKYLSDIQQAVTLLAEFTAGKQFSDYEGDRNATRSGRARVRNYWCRSFGTCEFGQSARGAHISEYPRIIAFRNIIAHGYAYVDSTTVWDIVQTKIPVLAREVEALLKEA